VGQFVSLLHGQTRRTAGMSCSHGRHTYAEQRQSESSLLMSSADLTFLLTDCSTPTLLSVLTCPEQRSKHRMTPLPAFPQKHSIFSCGHRNFETGDPLALLTAVLLPARLNLHLLVTKQPSSFGGVVVVVVVVISVMSLHTAFSSTLSDSTTFHTV